MVPCRCAILNMMSGAAARDYAKAHLEQIRTDGMGRPVHRCPETGVEWTEDIRASALVGEGMMLRRNNR